MSKKRNLKLNKIPITALMQILLELFEDGVDFIDIEGEETEEQKESDIISVTVRPEYYSENREVELELKQEEISGFVPEIKTNKKLTDDDINDLV